MDAEFWHKKWEDNVIGFHRHTVNPLLVKHLSKLSLAEGNRLFLPLCGKTLDIQWLLSRGYRVAGAELSTIAVEQLFSELKKTPETQRLGKITRYSDTNIDIFVGDIFDLTHNLLGSVDAIYDRAALVALPDSMCRRYTAHLMEMTKKAPQLLLCFEYDQQLMDGPPFSISDEEVSKHYRSQYNLTRLDSLNVPGGIKGQCPATENMWLLQSR